MENGKPDHIKTQETNISFVVSVYGLQDTETKSGDKRMDKLF